TTSSRASSRPCKRTLDKRPRTIITSAKSVLFQAWAVRYTAQVTHKRKRGRRLTRTEVSSGFANPQARGGHHGRCRHTTSAEPAREWYAGRQVHHRRRSHCEHP